MKGFVSSNAGKLVNVLVLWTSAVDYPISKQNYLAVPHSFRQPVIVIATETGKIQVANLTEDFRIQVDQTDHVNDDVRKPSDRDELSFSSLVYALKWDLI